MDDEKRRKRILWRAGHRGIKEADLVVGAFAARWIAAMDDDDLSWIEALLEEQDVDILAWAFDDCPAPERLRGRMLDRLKALDYMNRA